MPALLNQSAGRAGCGQPFTAQLILTNEGARRAREPVQGSDTPEYSFAVRRRVPVCVCRRLPERAFLLSSYSTSGSTSRSSSCFYVRALLATGSDRRNKEIAALLYFGLTVGDEARPRTTLPQQA